LWRATVSLVREKAVAKKATQSDAHDSARFSSRPRQDAADRFAARSLDAMGNGNEDAARAMDTFYSIYKRA
jgi:hypothetical protein